MITAVRKEVNLNRLYGEKLEKRLSAVEAFAKVVSKETGIKF